MSAEAVRDVARGALVVLDEVHHAGEEQAWGESLRLAFQRRRRRLSLSGTPFRSDTRAIPFIRYELDEAVPGLRVRLRRRPARRSGGASDLLPAARWRHGVDGAGRGHPVGHVR